MQDEQRWEVGIQVYVKSVSPLDILRVVGAQVPVGNKPETKSIIL